MKKIIAILMALSLLCAVFAASADMETPDWFSMPNVVGEDEDTTVDEAAFAGDWVLNVAFANTEYVTPEALVDEFDFNFMPYCIGEGKITQDLQQENGEFVTIEMPYTFEAGQLQGKDGSGRDFVVELLEDGNIVMSVFFADEDNIVTCLSVYLMHPAE